MIKFDRFSVTIQLVVALFVAALAAMPAWAGGSATAEFQPLAYTPGSPVTVTVVVSPDPGTAAYAVEDAAPADWSVSGVSGSGSFDAVNGLVKWGPFFDDDARTLSYTATAPTSATGPRTFSGTASFDGAGVAIGGNRTIAEAGSAPPGAGTAVRSFGASDYAPGVPLDVTIAVQPDPGTAAFAVEDRPPASWSVGSISAGGSFDPFSGLVKWGPFFDDDARSLTYRLTPPAGASGTATFSGTASFDGQSVAVGGEGTLGEGGPQPEPPGGPWLSAATLPGFEVKARITPAGGGRSIAAALVARCIPETLCLSGALPGRSELFVRVIGPRPNGFLWPNLLKFSTSELEVWIRQVATGQIRYYRLPSVEPGEDVLDLSGLADKKGFQP